MLAADHAQLEHAAVAAAVYGGLHFRQQRVGPPDVGHARDALLGLDGADKLVHPVAVEGQGFFNQHVQAGVDTAPGQLGVQMGRCCDQGRVVGVGQGRVQRGISLRDVVGLRDFGAECFIGLADR